MEMQGFDGSNPYFTGAGDGAVSNFYGELQELRWSQKRCHRILSALLLIFGLALLALIIVAAIFAHRINDLRQREGLIPHPNVTFASYSGDQSENGLTYGGNLFRGSGFWSSRQPLPGFLTDHAAITVPSTSQEGDQVYIIGGADQLGNVTDKVWRYNPIFHNYTAMAPMPGPRYRFGCALDTINNKIVVAGGRVNDNGSAGCVGPTYIYDVATNTWTTGADIPVTASDQCAGSESGFVYIIGGWAPDYSSLLNNNLIYDTKADKWTSGPAMPTARGDLMCTAFEGEIYAIGGYLSPSGQNSFSANVESYNPNTTSWTTQPSLLTPRGDGAVTVLPGDKMMVVGGEGHYGDDSNWKYPKHVNEVFYGADRTWVEKAMITTARFRTAAATAGGLAYVFGGADVCITNANSTTICPALQVTEFYLDVDHPHVYIYLKNDAYNDNAALTTYPV